MVGGALVSDNGAQSEVEVVGEERAVALREVGHVVEAVDVFLVDPIEDLVGPEERDAELVAMGAEFVTGEAEEVGAGRDGGHGQSLRPCVVLSVVWAEPDASLADSLRIGVGC